MPDAKRPPRGDCDCGRGSEGLGIDLGRKLLVIHGRCRRERERSNEEGRREAERGFPFIGVAHNLNRSCLLAAFWGATGCPLACRKGDEVEALVCRPVIIILDVVAGFCFYNEKGGRFKSRCAKVNSFLFRSEFPKIFLTALNATYTCPIRVDETSDMSALHVRALSWRGRRKRRQGTATHMRSIVQVSQKGGRGARVFLFCSHGVGGEKGRSVAPVG